MSLRSNPLMNHFVTNMSLRLLRPARRPQASRASENTYVAPLQPAYESFCHKHVSALVAARSAATGLAGCVIEYRRDVSRGLTIDSNDDNRIHKCRCNAG